jgi:hypothetical protein
MNDRKKTLLVIVLVLLVIIVLFLTRFFIGGDEDDWICDSKKGEWVRHGNPSAPKPTLSCGSDVQTPIPTNPDSICSSGSGKNMTYGQAKSIAIEKCKAGSLKDTYFCNPNSGTWWFDFTPNEPKEGCNPACVVFVKDGSTEINWRCTGFVESDN